MSQPATTRAKFRCDSVEDYGQSKKVNLVCVYEGAVGENEENKRFTKATPWGEVKLTIDNPAAAVVFKPGREYFADFHEAPASAYNRQAYE